MTSRKLRIAMLSAHSCPVGNLGEKDTGGMSVYIRELATEMGRQGHMVDIYTRVHDPADPQIINLDQQARLIHLKAGQEGKIHKLAVYSYLPDFACNLENFRKDNDLSYDLVFSHYWLSGWVGEYLQRWWQVPHITMFHTLGAIKNITGIGEDAPDLRIVTERNSIAGCHYIIAATEREKQELIFHYDAAPEKISVVPCGVNMELFRPVDYHTARQQLGLGDEKIILFVGRIDPLKGIEQLVKAMPHLKSFPGLKLMVIGGDSQHEIGKLQKLSSELNIQDSISFRGLIKHEQLPYFYSAADVCVVPSYYESFGLVALESLACGTPVVATDVGDLGNIIIEGETGYVVQDNSPPSLAAKIALALSKQNRDMASKQSIRESVNGYSWPYISNEIIATLDMALERQVPSIA